MTVGEMLTSLLMVFFTDPLQIFAMQRINIALESFSARAFCLAIGELGVLHIFIFILYANFKYLRKKPTRVLIFPSQISLAR